ESRFMAYQSVIHGATGLFYYGQFHCTKPNSASGIFSAAKDEKTQKEEFEKCQALNRRFWDQHRGFFHELNQASRIFVLPAAKPTERITASEAMAIESATRKSAAGDLYVLAVNADKKPRQTPFRLTR